MTEHRKEQVPTSSRFSVQEGCVPKCPICHEKGVAISIVTPCFSGADEQDRTADLWLIFIYFSIILQPCEFLDNHL